MASQSLHTAARSMAMWCHKDAKETIQKLKKRIIELESCIERMQREKDQGETNPFGFYALDIDMRRKLQGRPSRHVNL